MLDPTAIADFSARATAIGEAMHAAEVRFNLTGTVYPATITEPRRESLLPDGGQIQEGELVARIRKAALATAPAEQIILEWRRPGTTTWNPIRWRINTVSAPDLTPVWLIRCIPAN